MAQPNIKGNCLFCFRWQILHWHPVSQSSNTSLAGSFTSLTSG